MSTVRAVIAMVASKRWDLHQMDVKNAFLNGKLQEEVYMEQPQGYVHPEFPCYVCKLKKVSYGLKQAPKAWTDRISRFLQSIGFVISNADYSMYVKKTNAGLVVIVIYVDDLIITGDDKVQIANVKKKVCARYAAKIWYDGM